MHNLYGDHLCLTALSLCPADAEELGSLRDYMVDLVPKFIMAGGQLVKVWLAQCMQHFQGILLC